MNRLSPVFLSLVCMTAALSGRLLDNLDGIQELECYIMPLSTAEWSKSHYKGRYQCQKQDSTASTYVNIPLVDGTSINWSGYTAATNLTKPAKWSVSDVYGSWTVPTLVSTLFTSYVSLWVGIDGYTNSTVEQLGTLHIWQNGVQQNFAWFEMYPQGAYEVVGFPVNIGDVIAAEVLYVGKNQFNLSIINYTEGVSTVVPASYTKSNGQRSSAEWIAEAPSMNNQVLPLADFGTVIFTNCTATINNVVGSISNKKWKNDALTMQTRRGLPKAVPSGLLANGTSFSVEWFHQ